VFFAVLKHARRGDAVLCVTTLSHFRTQLTLAARSAKSLRTYYYDFYRTLSSWPVSASQLDNNKLCVGLTPYVRVLALSSPSAPYECAVMAYPRMQASKILHPKLANASHRYRNIHRKFFRRPLRQQILVAMSGNAGFTHDPNSVFEAAQIRTQYGYSFPFSARRRLDQIEGKAGNGTLA